jgi:hypothetical protein
MIMVPVSQKGAVVIKVWMITMEMTLSRVQRSRRKGVRWRAARERVRVHSEGEKGQTWKQIATMICLVIPRN